MSIDDDPMGMLQRIAAQTKQPTPVAPVVDPQPVDVQDWTMPGFGPGARVETSFGHVPIEALRRRDPVRTKSGRFVKVQSVEAFKLDRRFLLNHPQAQPVTIPKNAFGAGCPDIDVLVSGAQTMMLPFRYDERDGSSAESLIGQRNVLRKFTGYFTYYVIDCGEPCTAHISGLWANIMPYMPDISDE